MIAAVAESPLALSDEEDLDAMRGNLHELIYPAHLHGENLVMAALEPLIASLAIAIDADMIDLDDLTAGLGSLLSGKPEAKGKRKRTISEIEIMSPKFGVDR
jgi:hypothetical protein